MRFIQLAPLHVRLADDLAMVGPGALGRDLLQAMYGLEIRLTDVGSDLITDILPELASSIS